MPLFQKQKKIQTELDTYCCAELCDLLDCDVVSGKLIPSLKI